jgi:hypothetical protein
MDGASLFMQARLLLFLIQIGISIAAPATGCRSPALIRLSRERVLLLRLRRAAGRFANTASKAVVVLVVVAYLVLLIVSRRQGRSRADAKIIGWARLLGGWAKQSRRRNRLIARWLRGGPARTFEGGLFCIIRLKGDGRRRRGRTVADARRLTTASTGQL